MIRMLLTFALLFGIGYYIANNLVTELDEFATKVKINNQITIGE